MRGNKLAVARKSQRRQRVGVGLCERGVGQSFFDNRVSSAVTFQPRKGLKVERAEVALPVPLPKDGDVT